MHSRSLVFVLALCVGACGENLYDPEKQTPPPNREIEAEDVSWTFVRQYKIGPHVFRSQAELDSAWAQAPFHPLQIYPREEPKPTYDFSEKMVAGCSVPGGFLCYFPDLVKVRRIRDSTFIHYKQSPHSSRACLMYVPSVVFVRVSHADGEVSCVQETWTE